MPSDYNSARDELKAGFVAGKCSSLEFRRAQLAGIVKMLEDHVEEIATALAADMGRPKGEAEGEAWICIREAKEASANLKTWMAPEQKGVHVMFHPASAAVRRSPFGAVLIIGPYNYPLLLTIEPLIGAIAAGNATMLKPSELTPKVADFLERRLPAYVAREACQVVTGGVDVSKALLATKWDFIYFTGSPRVGQIVATAAAKFMTPTALELGGKAPVVVHESADLQEAARRIINTKAINAGQTCIAPDYVLVDEARHDALLSCLQSEMRAQFGDEPFASKDYGRMCSVTHFDRMVDLLHQSGGEQIRIGSSPPDRATKFMPLTLIDRVPLGSPLLSEEIFGPLLPIVSYSSLEDATRTIRSVDPTPLSLYVFTRVDEVAETLMASIQSGSVLINDCVMQHMNHSLPFGGIGSSGHGVCHGRWSFETFTFPRSVLWRHGKYDIDQTVPMPLRHVSAKADPALRPVLLKMFLLYGPYFTLPKARHLVFALLAALVVYFARH